jgi:urease accessory protein UreH
LTIINTRLSENLLETAVVAGKTRVLRSLAHPPVRFVQPQLGIDTALVFVSAFGGGMLEGDDYRFQIDCRVDSRLMFAPQANTRVFPCPNGKTTQQLIRGTVYARATAVSGGDPTVLYENSRFHQSQIWTLYPGSRLALLDWMVAGRLERGESFSFDSFESEVRVEDPEGRPLLSDRLLLSPADGKTGDAQAGMGGFSSHLAAHVMGPGWEHVHAGLETWLRAAEENRERAAWMDDCRIAGLGVREGLGFSLRALGRDRASLEPLAGKLFELLSSKEWLGFDYWMRKY